MRGVCMGHLGGCTEEASLVHLEESNSGEWKASQLEEMEGINPEELPAECIWEAVEGL